MRVCTFMVLVFLAVAGPGFARAQGDAPEAPSSARLRAMVWLPPETDPVLERVRGQTNDLGVDLLVDDLDPVPADPNVQLQIAYTLSERYQATLVIWFVMKQLDTERHFVVNIAIPNTHRLLTRDLGPSDADSGGAGISSAVQEGAALVVRAAIQAALSGSTIGEVHAAPFDGSNDAPGQAGPVQATPSNGSAGPWRDATTQTGGASAPTLEARAPNTRVRGDWPWAVGLELLLPYDGVGNNGIADCGSLRVEHRSLPFVVFAAGSGCITRELSVAVGTVSVGRQRAVIGANAVLWDKRFQAGVGMQVGAVFYERTTLEFPFGVSRTASRYTLGTLAPEFRLLVPSSGRVSAGITAGVDLLTSSLKFSYVGPPGLPTARANRVQPYATLGLAFRF